LCLKCEFFSRIYQILPQRIQQWQAAPSIAEKENRHCLETIRTKQQEARGKLVQLDLKHKELDTLIERAKNATIDPDYEVLGHETFVTNFINIFFQNALDDEETEMSMYCVTCGHEINCKTALKHLEKCFAKVRFFVVFFANLG
jgi:COMPASS component SPP1